MTHDQMVEVILAHKQGEGIEWRYKNHKAGEPFEWTPVSSWPIEGHEFNFQAFDYRVKPEPPKPRDFWLIQNDSPMFDWKGYDKRQSGVKCIHVREVLDENP